MKKKLLIVISCLILLILSFYFYSMKRIEGSWIIQYSIIGKGKDKIILPMNRFSNIENSETKNYVFGINNVNNIDDYSKYFAFGEYLKFTRQDEMKTQFEFKIEELNKDSLVLNQINRDRLIVYKKIPKDLKSNIDLKKLTNKTFELKTENLIDTIYIDNSYLMFKKSDNLPEKWVSDGYKLIKINGFDILLTGTNSTFIIKTDNGKIYLNQFGFGGELIKLELTEIKIDTKRVKQIVERIKEFDYY